jgi:hypothetical protein
VFRAFIKSICAHFIDFHHRVLHQESGQVLPIALAVITLGILVVGPFLNHAGTALKSSGEYKQLMRENYACEAGIEQAIWALTNNSLPGTLSEVGSTLTYNLNQTVNSLTCQVAITWLNSNGSQNNHAPGTINDAVLDTFLFFNSVYNPQIIHISGQVFAVVYRDSSNRGIVSTVSIDNSGNISNQLLDTSVFCNTSCHEPQILNISNGIFALVFRGSSNDGFIKTVAISNTGVINDIGLDEYEFETSGCYEPAIMRVNDETYCIAYRGPNNNGYVKTVQIDSSGNIFNNFLDSLEFDNKNCFEPELAHISGDIYGVVYRGQNSDGTLRTFSVDSNGQVGYTCIDSFVFDNGKGWEPDIAQIGPGMYAVAYRDQSNDGRVRTINIDNSGTISHNIIDSLDFDSGDGYKPNLIEVGYHVFAVVYKGTGNDGNIRTFSIDSNGQIANILLDSLVFDNRSAYEPEILNVNADIYVVAYRNSSLTGYLKTIEIASGQSANNTYSINSSAGNTAINASIVIAGLDVSVQSWKTTP